MKVTKFVHSCLLVEMPAPVNRTALFDPGVMSADALDVERLMYLDDIIITHSHGDHISMPLVKQLVEKFPKVRITTTNEVAGQLKAAGVPEAIILTGPSEGIVLFDAPHESVAPLFPQPEEIGVHYLGVLTDPGDSHTFNETKPVLALPVTAPWGDLIKATNLALELKPKHILPVHDWHWNDEARRQSYEMLDALFAEKGITFHQLETGKPVVLDVIDRK